MTTTKLKSLLVLLAAATISQVSSAGIIDVEKYNSGYNDAVTTGTLGGYSMTNFSVGGTSGDMISTLTSPIDGSTVGITEKYGNDVKLGYANSTSWWTNNTGADYNIFITHTNLIEIILPTNTLAFAFNVGANFNGSAWFTAYDQNGREQFDSRTDAPIAEKFAVGGSENKTPGFGLYALNSDSDPQSCNYISKVVVDPNAGWGVGNFSIAQDTQNNCGTTTVSEPGTIALFGLGLLGLAAARRRMA